jgi:hypothetical protein
MTMAVVMCVDTLIEGLASLQAKLGRELELVVMADRSLSLMAAEQLTPKGERATGFEEIAAFDSVDDLLFAMPWMIEGGR